MAAPAVPIPPEGHLYDNHDTEIISVAAVFAFIMTASFIIRLISIRLRKNSYKGDDLLLLIAYVSHPTFLGSFSSSCLAAIAVGDLLLCLGIEEYWIGTALSFLVGETGSLV